jgi:tetratricopeptide (TPR) repeat protein
METTPLTPAPAHLSGTVKAWSAPLVLPTYEPLPADRNPMFLEKRVFQGSSGRVYPLPFFDRVAAEPVKRAWNALFIENEYIRVIVLPDLGGRIYAAIDRINGYDLVYRNPVIKPALVGLAGPWISGGIEFNWPQHHRPSTYMPTDWEIEEHPDGSRTIWLSEHEPMNRMKGMHGVHLSPGTSRLELWVRLHNRTPLTQTVMWWANVATDVHEGYQSFFPRDAVRIADHAKRAMSAFPHCDGRYYGVDYAERARSGVPASETPRQFVPKGDYAADDLRWYANIPVPTSYMCVDSADDFFGGYDHKARAGIVHVADHHVAPGKKQWTWGNHEFGYAWDRNLTDPDENGVYHPYIELMAGVFTDNQPDFSFIAPGETKTFTQIWYPIRDIGPVAQANDRIAVSARIEGGRIRVGLHAVESLGNVTAALSIPGREIDRRVVVATPAVPVLFDVPAPDGVRENDVTLRLTGADGFSILTLEPVAPSDQEPTRSAEEPPAPEEIGSVDELYITGLHLSQYRHATRAPDLYWREALRRDPQDSRCNNAMGLWHLRRGEFDEAERSFGAALKRLRRHNANPYDGEAFYNLGLTLRHLGRDARAYDAFFKAAWNAAWIPPARLALAEISATRGDWPTALAHVEESLRHGSENLRARALKAVCLRSLGRDQEARGLLEATLALDPLDPLIRQLLGRSIGWDSQTVLDLALDHARWGDFAGALSLVENTSPAPASGTEPLFHYYAAYFADRLGRKDIATRRRALGARADALYCFPSRLEEITILQAAIDADPNDARAPYYLGDLLYDKRRHEEAVGWWSRSAELDPTFPTVWRNLGIGLFNIRHDTAAALTAYDKAFSCDAGDARILYERDQLWKRVGETPDRRLAEMEARPELVARRDDLCIEYAALLNQVGRPEDALKLLTTRAFQPWEGGEGMALEQYTRARAALGLTALERGDAGTARIQFEAALTPPATLGEAKHLLFNNSDIHYRLGTALAALGDAASARKHWTLAAQFKGDFLGMEVRAFSDKTYYSALSLRKLGRTADADKLVDDLEKHAEDLARTTAKIDYFATSLPTMLIFEDDLRKRRDISAEFMLAQVAVARGDLTSARGRLSRVRDLDPNHAGAADLAAEVPTLREAALERPTQSPLSC